MDESPSTDAGAILFTRLGESESAVKNIGICIEFLRTSFDQLADQDAPITRILVSLTVAVFLVQVWLFFRVSGDLLASVFRLLTTRSALEGLNAWYFLNYPEITWPLTEFIHRGAGHFVANIVLLLILGGIVEPKFRRRYYLLWFLGVALIATPIHAFVQLSVSPKPFVAVYGISDFISALGVYVLFSFFQQKRRTELWYLGLLIGVSTVINEGIGLIEAVWLSSLVPVNVGHLVGGILGFFVFLIVQTRRSQVD